MKHYKRFAHQADIARSKRCKRKVMGAARKAVRSATVLVGKLGEGLIQAAKVWFTPNPAKEV